MVGHLAPLNAFGRTTMNAIGIEAEVCKDIARRQQLGLKKYGISVADNPLNLLAWMQHAYEETLDQAVYLKRAMVEVKAQMDDHK